MGACWSGKIVYETRKAAINALKRSHNGGNGLRPYRCPYCESWHLGHPPAKKGAR